MTNGRPEQGLLIKEADIAVQVCRVRDGEEAIGFLERSGEHAGAPRPQLVLLNINMPRRNGLEVLEYMRSHESVREIPVVMFTTSADGKDRKRALALGAEAFLTKPRTYNELTTELSAMCARFLRAPIPGRIGKTLEKLLQPGHEYGRNGSRRRSVLGL